MLNKVDGTGAGHMLSKVQGMGSGQVLLLPLPGR